MPDPADPVAQLDSAPDRIDISSLGVDDVVLSDVAMFRLERMDTGAFWIKCYRDGKSDVAFWLRSTRKIDIHHEIES